MPPKSGCDFCPFMRKIQWRKLRGERPERFNELVEIEKNFKSGMTFSLSGTPLKKFLDSHQLDDFMKDSTCDSGQCFT